MHRFPKGDWPMKVSQIPLFSMALAWSLLLAGSISSFGVDHEDKDQAWIKWRNGDELRGEIRNSENERIHWKSEAFGQPLILDIDQLESVRFASTNRTTSSHRVPEFRVLLTNGDRLDGWLHSINRTSVILECDSFEEPFSIARDAIERIIHINTERLRFSGPGELTEWTSYGRNRKTTEWHSDLRGAFATHQWTGNLFKAIELPKQVEISFSAQFPMGKPNLEIGLLREASLGPMIETWDNYLVMTYRTQFIPVMELSEDTRELDFRMFWNQETGDLRLCRPSGEILAKLDNAIVERHDPNADKKDDSLDRGFSILNRTPELRLRELTIREWNGTEIPVVDLSRPRLLVSGAAPRFQTSDVLLKPGSPSMSVGGRLVPLEQLQELILSPAASIWPGDDREQETRIAWFAGSNISGHFSHLKADQLFIKPAWSETTIEVKLAGAKEIQFPEPQSPVAPAADHLTGEGLSLHGTTRPIGNQQGEGFIGWLAPGADAPVPLADKAAATIVRPPHPSVRSDLAANIGRARIFLTNDEIISGDLISIESDRVNFTSQVTGQLSISPSKIRAIDIGSAGRILDGFSDQEWEETEEIEEDVTVSKDAVTLTGGSFGNASILLGDIVLFETEWKQSYGALTLRLFADGPDPGSPSTDIIIAAQGNRLFVGKLKESGAFSFSGDQIPITGNHATFRIQAKPEKIEVLVNGKSTLSIAVDPDKVSGNGIYFKMGGGWQGWNQADNEITISNFRIERTPGSVPRRVIDRNAREKALAIPRIHRDQTPTHLLIAPNGDLLRGNLLSGVGDSIRFSSKNNIFDIPRHRVSAIIWLREAPNSATESKLSLQNNEAEESDLSSFQVTHQFVLMDGSRLRLAAEKIDGSQFVGDSSILGECRVAIENIREMHRGTAMSPGDLTKSDYSAFSDWHIHFTPDPNIPGAKEVSQSELIGKKAFPIELKMLNNSKFSLKDHLGKVVVLDFWATWCGPCIKAMPDVKAAIESFPPNAVTLCAINQAETEAIISNFLERRQWTDTPVALDFDLKAGDAYGVESIPQTVVINPEGVIIWVQVGYSKTLRSQLEEVIKGALLP